MHEQEQLRLDLLGSLLYFTQFFFKLRTNKDFHVHEPRGRESRQISICRELTNVLLQQKQDLLINIHPGSSKSELCIHFVAWALARFPDSNFLYVSYSKSLAEKHTHTIKRIMEIPQYQQLFHVELRHDSAAKGLFTTTAGGSVAAFGSGGSITGRDAGLPNLNRFSGALILDDVHKPDEVHSDTLREHVIENYFGTLIPRLRSPTVPIIGIGQRLHESDLFGEILNGRDGRNWDKLILKTIDDAGNNLSADVISTQQLKTMEKTSPYVYASQHQQNPMPIGGGIFKKDWFVTLSDEPEILTTFITIDTAETDKTYNDATVFSFWGLYKIRDEDIEINKFALHWLDCEEIWIEPRELEMRMKAFYGLCMRHTVQPSVIAIEKKSTGVTLLSLLKNYRGVQVMEVERNGAKQSKANRFLALQSFVANKLISLPTYGRHTDHCIEHMGKITLNDSHRWDDIADTCATAIELAFIDRTIGINYTQPENDKNLRSLNNQMAQINQARHNRWHNA